MVLRPSTCALACLAVIPSVLGQVVGDTLNTLSDFNGWNAFEWVTDVELFKINGYVIVQGVDTGVVVVGAQLGLSTFNTYGNPTGTRLVQIPDGFVRMNQAVNQYSARLYDGGYIVLSNLIDSMSRSHPFLIRFSYDLDSLWSNVLPIDSALVTGLSSSQVVVTHDQGFAISGSRAGDSSNGYAQAFVIRTNGTGQELWRIEIGDPQYSDLAYACAETSDHGLILAGGQSISGSCRRAWYARIDSAGNELWSRHYNAPGSCDNQINAAIRGSSGGYILTGSCYTGFSPTVQQLLTLAINEEGDTLWTSRLHGFGGFWNTGLDILEHPNGTYLISGILNVSPTISKGMVACLSAQGDSLWQYSYSCLDTAISGSYMRLSSIILDWDSMSVICAGVAPAYPGAPSLATDAWLLRIQPDGCIVPGCNLITGISTQSVDVTNILSVSPNPAKGGAVAHIALPDSYRLVNDPILTLTSSDGRRILQQRLATLHDQHTSIDLRAVPSGIYYLHLSAGDTWLAGQKMLVE